MRQSDSDCKNPDTQGGHMSGTRKMIISRFSLTLGIGALLAGFTCIPALVQAEPSLGMRGPHHERSRMTPDPVGRSLHRLLRHQNDLGLSGDQSAKIKAIAVDYAKTRIGKEADLKLAEVDVRTLMHDDKADLPAIEAAIKKSESARTALRLERAKALRAATAILTPEQRDKWRSGMLKRRGEGARAGEYGMERMATADNLPQVPGQ
jgi:periplasmic protein CpxP/Spy